MSAETPRHTTVYWLQVVSLSLIWIFVAAITIWIINLIFVAIKLNDAPNASIGISLVVIPVFFTLAGVLTYVFVGLQKYANDTSSDQSADIEDQPS